MFLNSILFKQKARAALKGNWQTALVVTFFTGIFSTVAQLVERVTMADIQRITDSLTAAFGALPQGADPSVAQMGEMADLYRRLASAIDSVPMAVWIGIIVVNVLSIVLTPALSISCCRYFVRRDRGEDPGVKDGLFSCMPIWGKSFWLYVRMYVQTFLWSLLFIIPGVMAAMRYSMAPYYLADDPSMSAGEAIAKSKQVMEGKKLSFLVLMLSFVWWSLAVSAAQFMLQPLVGSVLTLVIAQFFSLWVSTYINASYAAFYRAVTRTQGMDDLMNNMRSRMREMGMSDSDIHDAGFAPENDPDPSDGDDVLK